MSSRRARSGGSCDARSRPAGSRGRSRKSPQLTSCRRSRWVAATMRTSTRADRVPPTRRDLAALEHAQELGLQRERQLANLVEEQRAAVGRARRRPARSACAPVKAPRSCPNSSLSRSVSGIAPQSTTTNGPAGAGSGGVERARRQLLARPGLAQEQHRARLLGSALEQGVDRAHGRAGPDQVAERRGLAGRNGTGAFGREQLDHRLPEA